MKIIDNKKINITDAEYDYYLQLVKKFTDKEKSIDGKKYFKDVFHTDENGYILLIKTEKSIPWAALFWLQQIMINQRMRVNDELIKRNEELILKMETLMANK